jgi:hypothetical protein
MRNSANGTKITLKIISAMFLAAIISAFFWFGDPTSSMQIMQSKEVKLRLVSTKALYLKSNVVLIKVRDQSGKIHDAAPTLPAYSTCVEKLEATAGQEFSVQEITGRKTSLFSEEDIEYTVSNGHLGKLLCPDAMSDDNGGTAFGSEGQDTSSGINWIMIF